MEQEKITFPIENLDSSKPEFNIEFLPKQRDFYLKECFLNNQPFCCPSFEQNQLYSEKIIKYDENAIKNINKKTVHQRRHNRAASSESLQITSSAKKYCQLVGHDLLYNRAQSEENIPLNLSSHLKRSSSQDSQTFQKPCYGYTKKYIQNFYDESINQSSKGGEYDYINSNGLNDTRNESIIIKRGYNNDYIVPVTNCVPITCSIYNTRLSQSPRRSSGFNYSTQNDESNFLFNSLLSAKNNFSNQLFLKKEIESGFRAPYTNKEPPGYESSQHNVIKRDQTNVDYIKYKEPRFSSGPLKEPPSYSNSVLNMLSDANIKQSHSLFKSQSRPHSYDGNIETVQDVDFLSTETKNDSEKRNQPKRTHSMPAVKHIDERSRIAKTFLIDEETKTPKRLQNKPQQANCRRKSIDSGTLKKLALELQNNPELGCEYPMISQLLGESQFSAIERRGKNLYRHKSTEAISSKTDDKNVEFL